MFQEKRNERARWKDGTVKRRERRGRRKFLHSRYSASFVFFLSAHSYQNEANGDKGLERGKGDDVGTRGQLE